MWTVDKNLQQFCAIFQLSKLFLCCWSLLLPHLQWSDDHSCTNFGKFLIKHFQLNFCLNHLKLFVFLVVKIGTECSKLTLKSRWYIQVGTKRKFSNLIFGETIWNSLYLSLQCKSINRMFKEPMISRWAQGESLEELIRTSGGRLLSWSVEYHAFHSFF